MSKSSKQKKNKVPKITEEEYAAYVTALKGGQETVQEPKQSGFITAPTQPKNEI